MTLHTPRRRISPRTIRRYRAIKNFVRRALGSSSQPDIKTNSSVCVSVLDLRQKIHGIEQQLNSVSKHCQDLASLESRFKLKDNTDSDKDIGTHKDTTVNKTAETELVQKIPEGQCKEPVNSKSTPNIIHCNDRDGNKVTTKGKMLDPNYSNNYKENRKSKAYHKLAPIEESELTLRRRNHTASRTLPTAFHMNYYHSSTEPKNCERYVDADYSELRRQRNRKKTEYLPSNDEKVRKENRCGDYKNKSHRNKYLNPGLDQDYISEIIRRQYRPVKLFGRRESEFSQFSAPVCRDQEFPVREPVQESSDVCSCCHEVHGRRRHSKYTCYNDLSNVRSICDARLYSSKNDNLHTNCIKRSDECYNDNAMYDLIPVKEKSSPKSRKKFVEDNMLMQDKYREVPPSPRTQRPRLNLQTQYQGEVDEDDVALLEKQLRYMKRLHRKAVQKRENISNISSEVFIHNRHVNGIQNSQIPCNQKPYNEECVGAVSSLPYPLLSHEQGEVNNDTTLNTQTTDASDDKTDKTLSEIKEILQNFLQEIKKESLHSEKLNSSTLTNMQTAQNMTESHNQINTNSFHNNNNCNGNCSVPPIMQAFPNSCCYPIVPICPMNCMQNGYGLPNPSFTYPAYNINSKERTCGSSNLKNNTSEDANNETKKMIKEIHNLISQKPNVTKKKEPYKNNMHGATNVNMETKILTSKSVGSSKASKHDAKVGTSNMKSHSKSCEAIGSREATNTRYAANNRYSDTVLEKESGEETITEYTTESQYSSESTVMDKVKENKFKKILRSVGILKKSKRDATEQLSESANSVKAPRPMQKPPFPQHIINYNVHGQEYFNPHRFHQHQYEYNGHTPGYDPKICYSPTYMPNRMTSSQDRHVQELDMRSPYTSPHHMTVPPGTNYNNPHYLNISPQVPVCFKEIEVKSVGTQSVRHISLLQKFTNKMQVPAQQAKAPSPQQSSTRTPPKDKTANLFDWKKIHEKAMERTTDPLKFTYNTQQRLAERDNTMRNAMLKKLFYKRNPFSPRNLLVRTLLGKDRSSFGEYPKMYKPKMFL